MNAHPATSESAIDQALTRLRERAREFARLPIRRKIALLEGVLSRTEATARSFVKAACEAKGLAFGEPEAAEEWLSGPVIQARHVRLLIESLRAIAARGAPDVSWRAVRPRAGGELVVPVFPTSAFDRVLFSGFSAEAWLRPDVPLHEARARQASFYKERDPEGGVSLVLGAGNVSSIGPLDALHELFSEGRVCVLKMNPVNEHLGPFVERQFEELVERGYFAVVYGGAAEGEYLTRHPAVDHIHITGSDRTHDTIVWGPPGDEREQRKARNEPLLQKPISSELGNVTPLLVTPAAYTERELDEMATNVAAMVTNNASFNCNAAKLLVTAGGWPQREAFLDRLGDILAHVPPRLAYYPGAEQRYELLTRDRREVFTFGTATGGRLPWTLLPGLDPSDPEERSFTIEPFCAVLSETSVGSRDPAEFLSEAVRFVNERVWGTLTATVFAPASLEQDPGVRPHIEQALVDLRYGVVNLNHWGALVYAFCSPPWGAAPGSSLTDVQSGRGWVHNTYMLEGVEKVVMRGPLVVRPKPAWYPDHKTAHKLSRRLLDMEMEPRWRKLPGILYDAVRG